MKKTKDDELLDKLLPKNYDKLFTYWSKIEFKTKLMILGVILMKYSVQILSVLSIFYYILKHSWIISLAYLYYIIFKKPKKEQK